MDRKPRATASFREEHAELLRELGLLEGRLAFAPLEEVGRRELMTDFVDWMDRFIAPHAEWEENALYPVVDRTAKAINPPFTATMRYEHRIIGRWLRELGVESAKSTPDFLFFTKRGFEVIGLLRAHFEEEEAVLLPLLDETLSEQQFKQLVHRSHAHH